MSSITRKIERNVIKYKIKKDRRSVKECFSNEWAKFRESKYVIKDKDGNVLSDNTPKNTMPKKKRHFDNVEQYNGLFAFMEGLNAKDKGRKDTTVME